jgi:hypothetical protein
VATGYASFVVATTYESILSILSYAQVAREHYLANFNFEKYSLPETGDEAAILKFMTSIFVKQTFARVCYLRS